MLWHLFVQLLEIFGVHFYSNIWSHCGNDWKVTMRCNQILSNQSLVSQPRGGEEACTPTTTTRSLNKMIPKTFPKVAQYRVSILFLFAVKLMAVVFIFVLSFQISRIPWLCSSNSLTLDNSGIKLSSYQSSSKPITWLCILYRHLENFEKNYFDPCPVFVLFSEVFFEWKTITAFNDSFASHDWQIF